MSEWIDVKDRLPEHEGRFLVWADNYYLIGSYSSVLKRWYTTEVWLDQLVTHWQLLPEPPANLQDTAEPVKHDQTKGDSLPTDAAGSQR